jgi:cytidine deaminase
MDHKSLHLTSAEILLRDLYESKSSLDLLLLANKAQEIQEHELINGSKTLEVNGGKLSYETAYQMICEARAAREYSYAPYSHFNVGAAILAARKDDTRTIKSGCNVENAAYSPTFCAECTAAVKAVSEGFRLFHAYAVVGGFDESMPQALRDAAADDYITPCGRCRQVTKEFESESCLVIVAKDTGKILVTTLEYLLPVGFGPRTLGIDVNVYSRSAA